MTKICTSLKQSKKLIELGIDITTADMFWSRCTITDFGDGVLKVSYAVEPCNISQFRYTKEDVPAWSLSALLELMPPYLFEFERGVDLIIYPNLNSKGWLCSYMPNTIENMKNNKFKQITNEYNPTDAVFEMVVWLKENKMI